MRPTFLGFESARKSLAASQKALDITSNNIANANTPGYTRQRLDLFSMISTSNGTRIEQSSIQCSGQGVYAAGVNQIRDPFLDKRYRELNADTQNAGVKAEVLKEIENILDNIDTEGGLQNQLLEFQKSLQSFATDSTDRIELANIAVQTAKQLVNVINNYDFKLSQLEDQVEFEINASVSDMNATLDKIAVLNKQIADSYVANGSVSMSYAGDYTVNTKYGPNELIDARNVLLDSLSQYGDIETVNEKDGTVTVKFGGSTVISGYKATQLSFQEDTTTGALVMAFNNGEEFDPESGTLKAYIEMYNGNGCYYDGNQNVTEGIPYYRSVINEFARSIANEFNAMNVDPADPTTERPLFVTSDGSALITAENLRVSEDWLNEPLSIIPPSQNGELDNAHIFRLLSVFDKAVDFGKRGDFTGTFDEYISYYSNKLGAEISFQSGKYTSNDTLTTSILTSRDSISGVSLDEEGINMMNYQKWFNASARIMTTLDEALDTIIKGMGLVGR